MIESDKPEFGMCLAAMAAVFREECDEAMLAGYWMALSDLELPALKRAVQQAVRTLKFMPRAAELRELSGDVSLNHRAVLAYDHLASAIERIGGNKSVSFDDPALNATVRAMGGWPEVCELSQEEFHGFKQSQFERTYKAFATVGVSDEQGAPLSGLHERSNRLNGYEPDPPVPVITRLTPAPRLERATLNLTAKE